MKFFPVPITELLITTKCNMNCSYCFEKNKSNKSMSKESIDDFVSNLSTASIMIFGGEPLMVMDKIVYIYDEISKLDINEAQKKDILNSMTSKVSLITNGTLIEKNIEDLKRLNIGLQISLDGPEEINDLCRIYMDGRGTYNDIINNIEVCIKNDIPWGIHGAIGRNNFNNLPILFDFYWHFIKLSLKNDIDKAIHHMSLNIFQYIFEEEYTDGDIDTFIINQEKVFNMILTLDELTDKQKKELAKSWFKRRGSTCAAGSFIFAFDDNGDMYPCHRPAFVDKKLNFSKDNIKKFNTFINVAKNNTMYSAAQSIINWEGDLFQQNWCPSANIETSDSVYYQSSKYNVFIKEYGRFVSAIFRYAHIE